MPKHKFYDATQLYELHITQQNPPTNKPSWEKRYRSYWCQQTPDQYSRWLEQTFKTQVKVYQKQFTPVKFAHSYTSYSLADWNKQLHEWVRQKFPKVRVRYYDVWKDPKGKEYVS